MTINCFEQPILLVQGLLFLSLVHDCLIASIDHDDEEELDVDKDKAGEARNLAFDLPESLLAVSI